MNDEAEYRTPPGREISIQPRLTGSHGRESSFDLDGARCAVPGVAGASALLDGERLVGELGNEGRQHGLDGGASAKLGMDVRLAVSRRPFLKIAVRTEG